MKKKAKVYKIDTEQRYMSTYDFVGHNNLSELAKLIFGRGWVAEDDVNQVQEICDTIEKGRYLVRCLNIPRIDEDIEVLDITGHESVLEWFNNFVDFVANVDSHLYNKACKYADELEEGCI